MDDDSGRIADKIQRYLDKIPPENHHYLDDHIESEEDLNKVAKKLPSEWKNEYHHLGLEYRHVQDIVEKHSREPEFQRITALHYWKDKSDPDNTYRELLHICAKAGWNSSANVIVGVLSTKGDHKGWKQERRHSHPVAGHVSRKRQHSYTPSEPPVRRPRIESLSSGTSSDADFDNHQACSSPKTLPRVAPESSLILAQVRSLSSGDTSDVEVDHPRARASSEVETPSTSKILSPMHRRHSSNAEILDSELADKKIDVKVALNVISNVRNYTNLGTQLFVPMETLNEIGQYPPEEQKSKIIQAWFRYDENPTYGKLHKALMQVSVDDKRAADQLKHQLTKQPSVDSSVSADGLHHETSLVDDSGDDNLIPINEATVLNAIYKIADDNALGIRLGLDAPTLAEINKHPVHDRKRMLVAKFFSSTKPENCNWTTVNDAINEMKVAEWNVRKSDTTTASVLSTTSITTTSSLDEFTLSAKEELKLKNDAYIMDKYSALQRKVARSLKQVDIEELKFHIETIFGSDDISDLIDNCSSVLGMFKNLKKHHLWNYSNITQLRSIAEAFIDDEEIKKEMEDYDASLIGYKAGTKIWQKMNSDCVKQDSDEDEEDISNHEERDPSHCKMAVRKRLVITILQEGEQEKGINVTQCSIQYLDDVFQQVQTKFKLSLDAVLHKVAPGSIEVTWYIPSSSAHQILNEVHTAVEFLKEIHISTMILEGVLIYSESIGVVNAKELNELRLLLAVQDRKVEEVNALIEGCSEILNEPMHKKDGTTLLMTAAFGGSIDIITSLINHGADINQQDANGWTSLSYAGIAGHKEAVNILIQHGADLTLSSKSSNVSNILDLMKKHKISEMQNLLMENLEQKMIKAAKSREVDFIQKALSMGANVDAMDKEKEGWRSLIWASELGYLDVVQHLLGHNSNPNLTSGQFNMTPLMLSCKHGRHEVAHCLLDHGANVDQETTKGWTSLRFAACYGRTEVGRLLIHHKATVNYQDTIYGYTPLIHAAQNGHADFVSMMINEIPGLDLDFPAEKGGGWNALMVACKNNHVGTVRELLLGGASPDHQNHNKAAAIHTASFLGLDEMVNSLMLFGADVNIADNWGKTALMFAVRRGNFSVVKRLMESDSLDVNAQEKIAMFSAPFFAIQCKELDILQDLMKSGKVNCELKDLKGKTLWDLIQSNSYHDASQLFEKDYPEEMNKMKSLAPPATAKAMREADNNMYIIQMLNHMDESMGVGAGAA